MHLAQIPLRPGSTVRSSRVRFLLGDSRAAVAGLVVGSVLCGITESGILAILAQVAAGLVSGSTHVRMAIGPVTLHASLGGLLAIAIGLAALRLALQGVVAVIPGRIAADLQARLRREMFVGFTDATWDEQSRDREGHLQEYLTNQTTQVGAGAAQATMLIVALTTFIVLVVSALALNFLASVLVLTSAVGLFVLLRPLSSLGTRRGHALARSSLSYAHGVSEAVRIAEETQVFGVSSAQRRYIDDLVESVRRPFLHTQVLARLVPGIYQSLIYLLVAGGLTALYLTGARHVASLGAVVLLLVRAGTYGQQVQGAYQTVRQSLPYLDRIQEAQTRYASAPQSPGHRKLSGIHSIAFQDVSFSYEPGRMILSNITFAVDAREAIGIVGPTGAGKSTLVQILLGLRFPTQGRYFVNGIPAPDFLREDWRRTVAYLPQEPRLLHASVADNIRFFRDLRDDAVESAARLAGIHDDIVTWPAGYDTIVGPRADAVSGGQQQRICLARAVATRPDVLVLDEPTSALDPQTELLIQESLAALKTELTLFVVAHRMSTLSICQRVMVIIDGKLQAFDTTPALIRSSAYFRSASELSAGVRPISPPESAVSSSP